MPVSGQRRERLSIEGRVPDVVPPRWVRTAILYNIRFMQNDSLVRVSRQRRRRRNKSKALQRIRNVVLLLIAAAILGVVGLFASFGYTYNTLADGMPELDEYGTTELAQTSIVYDANGEVVDELYGVQNRFVVSLDEINPTLQEAAVAIEDHRFY